MWEYIIPVFVITLLIIIYGVLNVEDGDSSSTKPSGCEHCGEKDSCGSSGHDDFVHFEIHKPEMKPAEGLFGKKRESGKRG